MKTANSVSSVFHGKNDGEEVGGPRGEEDGSDDEGDDPHDVNKVRSAAPTKMLTLLKLPILEEQRHCPLVSLLRRAYYLQKAVKY